MCVALHGTLPEEPLSGYQFVKCYGLTHTYKTYNKEVKWNKFKECTEKTPILFTDDGYEEEIKQF